MGVRVGALYWHVRNKHDVLVGLAEHILAEAYAGSSPGQKPRDWRDHLRGTAHRLRTAMLHHRDAARLIAGYVPLSPPDELA